jgi:hypothetical protein
LPPFLPNHSCTSVFKALLTLCPLFTWQVTAHCLPHLNSLKHKQ